MTVQHGADKILLTGTERRVTEMLMKCGEKIDQSYDDAIVGERCQT